MVNKWGLTGILSLILILASFSAYASESRNLRVDNIRFLDYYLTPGKQTEMIVSLSNYESNSQDDLKIKVVLLPEYDVISLKSPYFDISQRDIENRRIGVQIPSYVKPGYYLIKITISNSEFSRTKITEICVS